MNVIFISPSSVTVLSNIGLCRNQCSGHPCQGLRKKKKTLTFWPLLLWVLLESSHVSRGALPTDKELDRYIDPRRGK